MEFKEEEIPRWEANQPQSPPVYPWGNEEMG